MSHRKRVTLNRKTVEQFSVEIVAAWQNAVSSIIKVGKLLSEAKSQLSDGELTKLYKKLPFSGRTAQRLMRIAENSFLADPTHVSHLPPHWGTLYELSRIPADQLDLMHKYGMLNSELERKDVQALPAFRLKYEFYSALRTVCRTMVEYPEPEDIRDFIVEHASGTYTKELGDESDGGLGIWDTDPMGYLPRGLPVASAWLEKYWDVYRKELNRQDRELGGNQAIKKNGWRTSHAECD